MATPLHQLFAQSVQAQRNDGSSKEALLDGQDGLAARWSRATAETAEELRREDEEAAQAEYDFQQQAQLWDLIAKITLIREVQQPMGVKPEELLEQNKYLSPKSLVNAIFHSDRTLQEWTLIKSNLETFAEPSEPTPSSSKRAKSSYRHETLQEARRLKNLRMVDGSDAATSLDLDANVRTRGVRGAGNLAGKDKALDQKTVDKVYQYIRAGKLEEAESYCHEHDESWRVASINGGKAWGIDVVVGDVDMEGDGTEAVVTGNMRRDLWKKTCKAIATNSSLSKQERALYACLTGDLDNTLPACHTWEDHLWAHLNSKLIIRLDAKLGQLSGYWQDRYGDNSIVPTGATGGDPMRQLAEVFEQIERYQGDGVADQANEWYNRIKKAIVLGQGETVIDEFVEDSEAIREEDEIAWTTLNFFMTHFALYRRSLGLPVDEDSIRTLLESYIDQLGGLHKADQLVAIYSAELESGDRERAYAKYLELASATEDLSFEGKQQALQQAQEQDLDARKIANIVSSRVGDIVDFTIKEMLIRYHAYPKVQHGDASRRTKGINQSVEWLLCLDATFIDAVRLVNKYIRYYLISDNAELASRLRSTLPDDFVGSFEELYRSHDLDQVDFDHLEEMKMNFELLTVMEELARVEGVWSAGVEEISGLMLSQQLAWANEHSSEIDLVHRAVLKLVTIADDSDATNWIEYLPEGDEGDDRHKLRSMGYERLKKMHIGDVLLRLHDLLVLASEHLPKNLQCAIDLSAIVADPETELQDILIQPDYDPLESEAGAPQAMWMDDFLERMRVAVMESYRRGSLTGFQVPGVTL